MNIRVCAVALACALLFFGCSSSATSANKAPVIDSADIPATGTGVGGSYVIKGTITFHDDDDTVNELHLLLEGQTMVAKSLFPTPVMSGTAPVTLTFTGATPGQAVNYQITVVDSRGVESAAVMKSVTLQ